MKTNILLALGSTLLCFLAGFILLQKALLPIVSPQGSKFETVDDFRKQLVQRDERDVKKDKSVSFRSIVQPHESDSILYELRPNLNVKFQGVPVTTNSHGMRSPEISKKKPKGVYRIALLGDSFAFGWGVKEEDTFARRIEQELNKRDIAKGKRIELLNFGVPGYSSFQEVAKFIEFGQEFDPDLVLVFFVDNDFGLPFLIKRFDGSGALTSAQKFQRLRRTEKDEKIINRQRKLMGVIHPSRQLARLADVMQEKGVPVVITINPRKGIDFDVKRLYVLRHHDNVFYLEMRKPFVEHVEANGLTPEELTLKGDMHPNARRHAIYAQILSNGLEPMIKGNFSCAFPEKQAKPARCQIL